MKERDSHRSYSRYGPPPSRSLKPGGYTYIIDGARLLSHRQVPRVRATSRTTTSRIRSGGPRRYGMNTTKPCPRLRLWKAKKEEVNPLAESAKAKAALVFQRVFRDGHEVSGRDPRHPHGGVDLGLFPITKTTSPNSEARSPASPRALLGCMPST